MRVSHKLWEAFAGGTTASRLVKSPRVHGTVASRAAAARTAVTVDASLLRLVYRALFSSGRSARGVQASPSRYTGPGGLHFAAAPFQRSTRFTPRSSPLPPSFSRPTVGLGTARNFCTGSSAFHNVVSNAPFGIRALADAGLYDARKMRSGRPAQASSLERKGDGRIAAPSESRQKALMDRRNDAFDIYFPRADTEEAQEVASANANVRLIIPLVAPQLRVDHLYDSARLLPFHLRGDLQYWHHAAMVHDTRLRSLIEKLGIEDKAVRMLRGGWAAMVDLYEPWSVNEVRQALDLWGEESTWFDLIDLHVGSDGSPVSSLDVSCVSSVVSEDDERSLGETDSPSDAADEEAAWHDIIARSLMLPPINHAPVGDDDGEWDGQWSTAPTSPTASGTSTPLGSAERRWALHQFVAEVDAMERPSFVARPVT